MTKVPTLFARLAELAAADGAVPDDGSGIDGVWTTTVPASHHDRDWQVAINCDTETEHTIEDLPREGDTTALRPASATVWLGSLPAGVCTPRGGAVVVQATIEGPSSIEAELLADIEASLDDDSAAPTGGAV